MTRRVMLVRAHAKINLALRIAGRRSDGYHELRTVFQTLALHDTLACAACEGPFRIESAAAGVPLDARNLVWRAASALWQAAGRPGPPEGTVVHLRKRIPSEAGLGGGSSDAAAALSALSRFWNLDFTRQDLMPLAASLGADVPFFLWGGTACGTGRGDEIRPMPDMPHHWVVLLRPSFGVSTRAAFAWWDEDRRGPAPNPSAAGDGEPQGAADAVGNDLEAPVAARHPEIARMTASLQRSGAVAAAMTGSGSTVFGLFDDRPAAQAAAVALRPEGWRPLLTRFVDGPAYRQRSRPSARILRQRRHS